MTLLWSLTSNRVLCNRRAVLTYRRLGTSSYLVWTYSTTKLTFLRASFYLLLRNLWESANARRESSSEREMSSRKKSKCSAPISVLKTRLKSTQEKRLCPLNLCRLSNSRKRSVISCTLTEAAEGIASMLTNTPLHLTDIALSSCRLAHSWINSSQRKGMSRRSTSKRSSSWASCAMPAFVRKGLWNRVPEQ